MRRPGSDVIVFAAVAKPAPGHGTANEVPEGRAWRAAQSAISHRTSRYERAGQPSLIDPRAPHTAETCGSRPDIGWSLAAFGTAARGVYARCAVRSRASPRSPLRCCRRSESVARPGPRAPKGAVIERWPARSALTRMVWSAHCTCVTAMEMPGGRPRCKMSSRSSQFRGHEIPMIPQRTGVGEPTAAANPLTTTGQEPGSTVGWPIG